MFATPSTPSVIRDVVNILQDVNITPDTLLQGSALSIHNEANQMTIDPEHLDLVNIFQPGIPPLPVNVSLPPAMSRTLQFGGAEAHKDGAAPSCSPEITMTDSFEICMLAMMQKFNQPIWDTIHRIEWALGNDRIPRILQRAGPGYRSEHIVNLVPRASSASDGPVVMTRGATSQQDVLVALPFPSEPPVQEWLNTNAPLIARVDDVNNEEFPALEPMSRGSRHRRNVAQAVVQQRCNIPGATGPDDGHIALNNNNSHIKPLFANIIMQEAVARQQNVKQSADQARAIQGRQKSGNQGMHRVPTDSNLTEVTVIRFGGLENEEEECKFRA
jgi:hypothetical protein